MKSEIFNEDCMLGMARYPDKHFDLAIIDPPYGLDTKLSIGGGSHTKSKVKFGQRYKENGKTWDKEIPTPEYFEELKRVSKNQIIFGGNYYHLGPTRGFIIWDKPEMRIPTMSDCEFAWTSFDRPAKIVSISRGFKQPESHPTQKPIKLYRWILKNYGGSSIGTKILDTHLGSGSSRIAAHDMGFDFTGFEIDKDYFEASEKRFQQHISQLTMFPK